jgi:hypothetical protein
VEQNYQQLKEELGLYHYEGCRWQGGPIFGLFLSKWRAGIDIRAGYGSA